MNEYDEDITLIGGVADETDEFGNPIDEVIRTVVQASKKEVSQSEFYQAAQSNIRPSIEFIIHVFEYSGEQLVEWNSVKYSVIRTYQRNDDEIELYLEQKVGDQNG